MQRAQLRGGNAAGKGGIQLHTGEQDAQREHDPLARASQVTGDAFAVILFHNGLHFAVGSLKGLVFFFVRQLNVFFQNENLLEPDIFSKNQGGAGTALI